MFFNINAQTTIFSEDFEGAVHAFSLNTTDMSSSVSGYNPWVVNNTYAGGSGSLICLGFPFGFTINPTQTQPHHKQTTNIEHRPHIAHPNY